jgi:hypothetical protein
MEAAMSPFFYAGGEVVGMQVLDADGICGELEVTLFAFLSLTKSVIVQISLLLAYIICFLNFLRLNADFLIVGL